MTKKTVRRVSTAVIVAAVGLLITGLLILARELTYAQTEGEWLTGMIGATALVAKLALSPRPKRAKREGAHIVRWMGQARMRLAASRGGIRVTSTSEIRCDAWPVAR